MILKSIKLYDYRNYSELSMSFDQGINILYGDNAQGKTNILEALYLTGTTKSHRGTKDKELIRFQREEAHIRTKVLKNDISYKIDMHLKKSKAKGIAVNGIPIKRATELFGIVNYVFFSPEDLNIIKDGPSKRRRFIDLELSQIDRVYLSDLSNYNKIVNQRNKLLKELFIKPELEATISIWDQQLVKYGIKVIERRKLFIAQLNEIIKGIHTHLTGGKEELLLTYEPNIEPEYFEQKLERERDRDIRFKTTTVGPHRDDLRFSVAGVDIRTFGSQGQQRTSALSLKLAEIELVKKLTDDTPILLLDDVLSELDSSRQNYLLNSITDIQTIITCTGLDEFVNHRFHVNKIFRVTNGTVRKEN